MDSTIDPFKIVGGLSDTKTSCALLHRPSLEERILQANDATGILKAINESQSKFSRSTPLTNQLKRLTNNPMSRIRAQGKLASRALHK